MAVSGIDLCFALWKQATRGADRSVDEFGLWPLRGSYRASSREGPRKGVSR
jgi:hypothetical protein